MKTTDELKPSEADRRELLMLRYKSRQLETCGKLLDEAGVPEWVMTTHTETVPANATPCRLQWYLARRKNVSLGEIDVELNRDMGLLCGESSVQPLNHYSTQRSPTNP